MPGIKLFYSWQSDLDAKVTRNLIQDAIKAAVKSLKNLVTIDADRDARRDGYKFLNSFREMAYDIIEKDKHIELGIN